MSGAWACEACATRLGLGDGEGRAASYRGGFCGAGGHEVAAVLRWFEGAPAIGARPVISQPYAEPESPKITPEQVEGAAKSLFEMMGV